MFHLNEEAKILLPFVGLLFVPSVRRKDHKKEENSVKPSQKQILLEKKNLVITE